MKKGEQGSPFFLEIAGSERKKWGDHM